MQITAKDVKKLRVMTGAGMMDCKRALTEAGGNFDEAVDLLRKKGQKVAAKRAGREANQGLVVAAVSSAQDTGVMVEVNCETDFVARNDQFGSFARTLGEIVLNETPASVEELLALPFAPQLSVAEKLADLTGTIGEKLDIRRITVMHSDGGTVVSYVHPGDHLGVLVELEGEGDLQSTGRDVAMQVAALNPVGTHRTDVPADVRAKEKEIARESARMEGKPERIWDRIAEGKLERYYKDHVLLDQPFVKDSSVRVGEMVKRNKAAVRRFARFALGA